MTRIHRLYGSLLAKKRWSDVNIVDDLESLKDTKELSRENRYPEGEEPDQQSMSELPQGMHRRVEGQKLEDLDEDTQVMWDAVEEAWPHIQDGKGPGSFEVREDTSMSNSLPKRIPTEDHLLGDIGVNEKFTHDNKTYVIQHFAVGSVLISEVRSGVEESLISLLPVVYMTRLYDQPEMHVKAVSNWGPGAMAHKNFMDGLAESMADWSGVIDRAKATGDFYLDMADDPRSSFAGIGHDDLDKEAVGLIEGPAVDENKYGTDYGRADQAIPRDPAKKDLLRANRTAQAYLSGFPYEAVVSIRVQSKRDNSVESGTSILEIDVIDGATVSLAAKHPRLNILYEQVVSVKDLQYMLGNNLIGINSRYGDAYMNIIRPDRTEGILVWLDEALQSM